MPGRSRCHYHGGRNAGGKPGNKNALRHGLYSEAGIEARRLLKGAAKELLKRGEEVNRATKAQDAWR
ncbi:unnamed protein product [marine sediment metagenome]|uniref:Uncharacterized protein n=1 Tax=marine sediment metagenome TaxID=412755 RepID=X0XBT7_9ZZZZ